MLEPGQSPVESVENLDFVWESSDLSQRRNYNELQQNYLQMGSAGD